MNGNEFKSKFKEVGGETPVFREIYSEVQGGGVFTKATLEELKDRFGGGNYPFVIPAGLMLSQDVIGGEVKPIVGFKGIEGTTGTTLKVYVGNGRPAPKNGDTLSDSVSVSSVSVADGVATVTVTGTVKVGGVYNDVKGKVKPRGLLRSPLYIESDTEMATCSIVTSGVVYENRIVPVSDENKAVLTNIIFEKEV